MAKRRQHFAAHKAPICCAAWGKKYGGLFATGAEDHVINVWRLGNNHKLKSLDSLFNSPVTALSFNKSETKLAGGTEGGTIRVYDFENDKVLRTLNGHLTACTSLHFHPYASNYVISTSKDNNLKVGGWVWVGTVLGPVRKVPIVPEVGGSQDWLYQPHCEGRGVR